MKLPIRWQRFKRQERNGTLEAWEGDLSLKYRVTTDGEIKEKNTSRKTDAGLDEANRQRYRVHL